LLQLLDGQRVGIGRGQIEQRDMLLRQSFFIVGILRARVDNMRHTEQTQRVYVFGSNAPTDGKVLRDPAHVELVGQRKV
jgi:hypothetical protein